jgi:uncharacterized protein (TIGR03382 family)
MKSIEVERVKHHIARAEDLAAARDLSQLTHVQRLVRQLLLRVLADYRAAGRFPINREHAGMTPSFIDASGTRCAMAYLLEHGGQSELVAKIARERNYAYVRELADEPALLAWLDAAGLTVEEAAAIQPSYCSVLADCICGGDFSFPNYAVPASGVLEGVTLANGKVRVDAVYGDTHGITIGMEVGVDLGGEAVGTPMLIPIDGASAQPFGAVRIEEDGVHCNSQGTGETPTLAPDDLIAAVQAADCRASLAAADDVWAENSCESDGPGPGNPLDDGGCNASTTDGTLTVGILLALVGVLVRRRCE